MKTIPRFLILPVVLAAVACKGHDSQQTNDALNNDLSAAAHSTTPQESVSAVERTGGATPVHHYAHHPSYAGSGSSGGSAASLSRQPGTHTEKNTGRDAAIGAGAGAVLGAVTSKNKVKGGAIGAAVGGVLGAVIGNNVDKKQVPNP